MGLALARGGSILEPAGIGSVRHRGSFWQLLTEATPVATPLPKPCHANPTHLGRHRAIHLEIFWRDFKLIIDESYFNLFDNYGY